MNPINLTGANLSGAEGTGRTYTISPVVSGVPIIQLDNNTLVPAIDYIYNSTTQLVTFNTYITDAQYITIYYDAASTSTSGTAYTTALLVAARIRSADAFSSTTTPTLDTVNTWIEQTSREIDSLTNNIFTSTTATSTYLDYDGNGLLILPYSPVISVTLRYNRSTPNVTPEWITLESGFGYNYLLYDSEGEIEFINGNDATVKIVPLKGSKRFCADITYGVTTIPSFIQKLATLMVAKEVIISQIHSQANEEGGDIQVGTIRIGDPSLFSINAVKSFNDEIESLKKNIDTKFKVFRNVRYYG